MILFKSLLVGAAVSIPIGPLGFLCIKQTLLWGRLRGASLGLSIALADMLVALGLHLGFQRFFYLIVQRQSLFQAITGTLCLYLGWKDLSAQGKIEMKNTPRKWSYSLTVQTFFLSFTNPWIFLVFPSFFTALGIYPQSAFQIFLLGMGIFLGSMLWWTILVQIAEKTRSFFSTAVMQKIHRVSGIFLLLMGAWLVILSFISVLSP
jgi:threonine/homoserine/homoserine lactone efflux protein